MLRGEDTWRWLSELKSDSATANIPVIVVTSIDDERKGLALGADAYCLKPLERTALLEKLDSLTGRRILVIDDDPAARYLMQKLLADPHTTVLEAADGRSGLIAARRARPSMIFLDLGLPDFSGEEILEALKNDTDLQNVPVAIVTASKLTLDERTRLGRRAEAVLQKSDLSSGTDASDSRVQWCLSVTTRRVLILNCDDTVDTRYAKTRVLRQGGYEVVECDTGQEALKKTRELMPDLVLCDVQLPDMSGLDVCRRIKEDAITGIIPVIQISATFVTKEHQREALKYGADIYLTEPLEPKELETVVSVLLRLARTEAGLREALARERAARAQAEEATQLKDEFLANLSHELRTPMNIIIGWSHLLRTGPLDESQKQRATEAIERAARSQAQLIEDLLDVSRIVTGKFRLVKQDVDVGRVLQLAIDSLRLVAQAKQLTINLSREGESARISGDPDRLQQVFWNLLSNAVKFTPAGGRVDVRLKPAARMFRLR
jgi:CheY-like chemotaxis protein